MLANLKIARRELDARPAEEPKEWEKVHLLKLSTSRKLKSIPGRPLLHLHLTQSRRRKLRLPKEALCQH